MPRPNTSANKKQPPKTHSRGWHEGTVKEVRPGVWRAWRARVKTGSGSTLRPSRTFAGPEAAERAALWAKGDVGPAVLLLGDWLNRWLTLRRPTLAANTYDHYRRDVLACAPLAGRPLADLTVDDWQALTNGLLARWARSHVAVWRGNISVALRAAMPDQLATNPLAKVKLPKPDEQPPKAWRQDEIDRLLAAAAGGTHEPWLVFSLGTGVRLGEARALRWADVDLAARTATIRASLDNSRSTRGPTKTRKVRVIDLPDEVIKLLADHRKRQPAGAELVFGHDGRAYRARTYRSWLATRCTEAGVTPLPPHSLRHTYASLAFDALVPVQDVARQLGHTVETCQRTYAHFIGDGMRRAAKAIGKALRHRFSGPKRVPRAKIGTR
jgi:integrase